MKIKSVSGITCYVKSLAKTAAFYEALGFEIRKRDADHVTAYSNWFWMDFLAGRNGVPAARAAAKDGMLVYLSVDDVDGFYAELVKKGLKPSSKPQDSALGNREFVLRDPDGYRLVIFKRR